MEIQKEWVLLRRNLQVPLNQLDKNFWKLFYSPHDVKKWTQGGDPKKVFPLSVIIASPLSTLTWTAATAESGGRVKKSICLLKSNYRPLLLQQLLNLLNSSVTFCPLPPAKRLCQRTKFAEMRGSVCKIGEQRKKDVSILRSSQMLNYCHFYKPFCRRGIRLKCAKLRYKKMHHSSPRRVWKAKAKDWNVRN